MLLSALVSQFKPSYNPSPDRAQAPYIYHFLPLSVCNPNFSVSSATLITPKSYLLASTNNVLSLNSSSASIPYNSSLANSTLSLSEESTTYIRPYVLL